MDKKVTVKEEPMTATPIKDRALKLSDTFKLDDGRYEPQPMGVEGDGGIVSAIAVILQGIYSILGLVVGIIFLGVGLILLLGGIGGSSHFVAEILGGKFEISDATAGLVCAVLGSIIIWVSRFNVFIHSK